MPPNLLIIGAMKAGTSILCRHLEHCPALSFARPRQPNFFSLDSAWSRGLGWYERCFAHCPRGAVKIDASTTYARYPRHGQVASRAAAVCPDAKILYLIRNPIDRAVSHYRHRWFARQIPRYRTFAEFVREDPNIIHYGLYHYQLSQFLDYFPRERIAVLLSENLFRDPPRTHRKVCEFLSIESRYVPAGPNRDGPAARPPVPRRLLDGMRHSKLIPAPLRRLLRPAPAATRGGEIGYHPPAINLADCREMLMERFMPDIEKMSGYLGMDLAAFWALKGDAAEAAPAAGAERSARRD